MGVVQVRAPAQDHGGILTCKASGRYRGYAPFMFTCHPPVAGGRRPAERRLGWQKCVLL